MLSLLPPQCLSLLVNPALRAAKHLPHDGRAVRSGSQQMSLENTEWKLSLDIGTEPGTWMPPR